MPVYILLLIAIAPVLAMVATAGDVLGRGADMRRRWSERRG
jgi:hypothetical protein